jgi:hypothetical protein
MAGRKGLPPLVKRDAPDLGLERASEIIAVAGPRRAAKPYYMYQLIHDLLAQRNWSREDILRPKDRLQTERQTSDIRPLEKRKKALEQYQVLSLRSGVCI